MCKQKISSNKSTENNELNSQQKAYLKEFNVALNGKLHTQSWAKTNILKFHNSNTYVVSQCTVCYEAWPLRSKSKDRETYVCSRDKKSPKKFSAENSMIPSPVPKELQGLSQVEEMVIACALPIMRVYVKPGGQKGHSGHCINLPQDVTEIVSSLPRYPKDLSIIIVKMKGKDSTFKDVNVRRQKVYEALLWLSQNNPHYSDIQINVEALNTLSDNDVPSELLTVETENEMVQEDKDGPVVGSSIDKPSEDVVYNETTNMSSFLPVGEQQELDAMRSQLSADDPVAWPTVQVKPINEYQIPYLATMVFPTLFPDGKGNPTNQALETFL